MEVVVGEELVLDEEPVVDVVVVEVEDVVLTPAADLEVVAVVKTGPSSAVVTLLVALDKGSSVVVGLSILVGSGAEEAEAAADDKGGLSATADDEESATCRIANSPERASILRVGFVGSQRTMRYPELLVCPTCQHQVAMDEWLST